MENQEWNKLQLTLYQLLKNKSSDVKFSDVIDSYKGDVFIWSEFIKLLKEDVDDYEVRDINSIKVFGSYLIIKFNIWNYLIIDCDTNKCLGMEEVALKFGEDFFIDNFKESKIGLDNYWFYDIGNVSDVINFYNQYSDVLSSSRVIRYEFSNELGRIGIDYNLVKEEVILYIHGFGEHLRVNYLFFDSNLSPRGVSNPTGNMDDLKRIADDVINLMVSESLLKDRVKKLKLD